MGTNSTLPEIVENRSLFILVKVTSYAAASEWTLGQVIKGWDVGVATMKQGELAVLTCTYQYAYGEAGSPPTIPPKSTLVFEVELLGWEVLNYFVTWETNHSSLI